MPVDRVKVVLFIVTAACATLVAIMSVLDAGSTDAGRGFQKEIEAIVAAVIGLEAWPQGDSELALKRFRDAFTVA